MQQAEANLATGSAGPRALPAASPETAPVEGERLAAAAARKARSLGQGNLMLIAMFLTTLGGLYLLSEWRGPTRATAENRTAEHQVDDALARLDGNGRAKTHTDVKALVDGFYGQAKERQIVLADLACNPFVYQPVRMRPSVVPKAPATPTPTQVERTQRVEDALKDAQALRLQSVLVGQGQNSAIISNNLLTVGQKIRGWTVKTIRSRQVVLSWQGHTYILRMPE